MAVADNCHSLFFQTLTMDQLKKPLESSNIRSENPDGQLQAFRSQMNPHFLFNALNAIQFYITTSDKKSALSHLSTFGKLILFHFNHIDKDTVLLKDEIRMLNWYFSLQKLRYTHQFNYDIITQNEPGFEEARIPSFLLQTLFENTIEHAIYNQYKNYRIEVSFSVDRQTVSVDIVFTHDPELEDTIECTPEYREKMMLWQDQIQLLNVAKNYDIRKTITLNNNPYSEGGNVSITLPNLS